MSRNACLWLFATACASGAILLYTRPVLLPLPFAGIGLLLFVVLLAVVYRRTCGFLLLAVVVLTGLLSGAGWTAWHASELIQQRLPDSLEGEPLEVSGYLCDLPSPGAFRSQRFSLCVTGWGNSLADAYPELPEKLRLSVYGDKAREPIPHRLSLTVVLKRPHGSVNPVGFRYESWLFRHGYGATGSVRALRADNDSRCPAVCRYHRWRSELVGKLEVQIGAGQYFPLALALLTGYRGALTDEHWDTLKATGTIHLVAISGLHLGLVALAAGFLVRSVMVRVLVGKISPGLIRQWVFWCVVLASTGYALLAGFTIPTRRALLMVILASWYLTRAARPPLWQGWLLALAVVLVFDPRAPLDRGFWLSFLAVAVLLMLFGGRAGRTGPVRGLVLAQAGIFAGLLPALAWAGEGSPVAGLVANLLAIPVVSVLVMPVLMTGGLLLVILPSAAGWVAEAFDLVLGLLWVPLEVFSALSLPQLVPSPEVALLLSATVLALVLVPGSGAARASALVIGLWGVQGIFATPEASGRPPEHLRFHVWDVGQGLSVLVEYGDRTLLYDTGPGIPGSYSAVEDVLLPNFRELGITRIDTLVISHADSDHSGGLQALLDGVEVQRILTGEPERMGEILPGLPVQGCAESEVPALSPVRIRVWRFPGAGEGNDASCVVAVESPEITLLLPGDITRAVEDQLVDSGFFSGISSAYRVMLAPHHGSKTSSGDRLLTTFRPDLTLFSAGYRHRYGHPHPDVVTRYREMQLPAVNIACTGAMLFEPANGEVKVVRARDTAGFWIERPGPPCERI